METATCSSSRKFCLQAHSGFWMWQLTFPKLSLVRRNQKLSKLETEMSMSCSWETASESTDSGCCDMSDAVKRIHADTGKPSQRKHANDCLISPKSGITPYQLNLCWSVPLGISLWGLLELWWLQTQTYWQHYSGIRSLSVCLRFYLKDIIFWILCSFSSRTLNTFQIPGLEIFLPLYFLE